MIRRQFLHSAAKAVAGAACLHGMPVAFGEDSPATVTVSRDESRPGVQVPADFVGLGYEMSSAARPGLLSSANTPYVNLVRHLGSGGVMRFGGIVADFTRYQAEGAAKSEPKDTVVTRDSLVGLRAFLDRTGWGAIWSVNFGAGTMEEAITEARDVASVLGSRLLFLELGNEVENYGRGAHPLRKPPYSYADYRAEYARWHDALSAALPGLRFAAPDTAASVDWVEAMAADANGTVQLLTTHYYRGGQQQGTPEQLATPDPELDRHLQRLHSASQKSGIPWRMCETNSFFGGGRPGVSNTLLGALWTLDYMLLLGTSGCAGVNLETGVNQLGFVSSYSPIQDDGQGHNSAGAPYYGMLAFAQAFRRGSKMLPVRIQPQLPGLTVYAVGTEEKPEAVVIVNRSSQNTVTVSFGAVGLGEALAMRLEGSAELSGEHLTFGGTQVDSSGSWRPARAEPIRAGTVRVSPMSAAVLVRAGAG